MIKKKLYRYLGKNGIITSLVELMGIDYIPMYRLEASSGYVLTNGEQLAYSVDVFAEDISEWYEIEAPKSEEVDNR